MWSRGGKLSVYDSIFGGNTGVGHSPLLVAYSQRRGKRKEERDFALSIVRPCRFAEGETCTCAKASDVSSTLCVSCPLCV